MGIFEIILNILGIAVPSAAIIVTIIIYKGQKRGEKINTLKVVILQIANIEEHCRIS